MEPLRGRAAAEDGPAAVDQSQSQSQGQGQDQDRDQDQDQDQEGSESPSAPLLYWPVDGETELGFTALHLAASQGHSGCVSLLLQAGADLSHRSNALQYTPLHIAAHSGRLEAVRLLLRAGADAEHHINRRDAAGCTPLHEACINNHVGVAAMLLARGADGEVRDAVGRLPDGACLGQARAMVERERGSGRG